jgi:hypothetical protein
MLLNVLSLTAHFGSLLLLGWAGHLISRHPTIGEERSWAEMLEMNTAAITAVIYGERYMLKSYG